ncbi:hypothetical protein M5X00_28100 [Paenibacillus alvei]|uniref:Uncharacterized protein n=1 Tax=Paenibacillus alvei TaxID=44250 RepID=A0ABT4H1N6_PAEAL|nr:hypothetical protein [Paenibacillus alvei]EJW15618.1 hypothetical protein PAV_8c02870 [Paenibacillus alvei DSM 29]MCY9542608.1 hypothetical protein [Paenibacillus alvei]MCY9706501.1 hypothetical protein [Paenibacillus alvei]MCY9736472.1 hypothetical protein [Paenibacillus alvei]MCY9758093.1 hypothetical protein [Paenibacillus alvei]
MGKSFLEPSIQTRVIQLNDEYENDNEIYRAFDQKFKELMKYIPNSEVDKYLELENLFYRKSEVIEFTYRAAINDILMIR